MSHHSIGFIAKYYGVSPSTVRRWEALGIIPKSVRTPGGHRRFSLPDWRVLNRRSVSTSAMRVYPVMIRSPISSGRPNISASKAATRSSRTSAPA